MYRESNKVDDFLANASLQYERGITLYSSLPTYRIGFLEDGSVGTACAWPRLVVYYFGSPIHWNKIKL